MKSLQKKEFEPIYLLYGDEPYYVDVVTEYMVDNVLDETEKAFNQVILYGRDVSAPQLADYCKRFPMIGTHQLVVLKEAQDLDLKKDENQQYLISYLRNPSPSTILLLAFKYKSPAVKLMNAARKEDNRVVIFESKKKYDNDIPVWISEQVIENGYTINNKACQMLQEYLGNNLEKIANELGKLYINIPKSKQITEELIEQFIGISKDYNVTELQKAIAYKNSFKAYQIVQYFADNPKDNPIFKTIPILLSFFTKTILLHSHGKISDDDIKKTLGLGYYGVQDYKAAARNYSPDKLMSIVSWLREANTKAIGIDNHSIEHGELLKELIFKILH